MSLLGSLFRYKDFPLFFQYREQPRKNIPNLIILLPPPMPLNGIHMTRFLVPKRRQLQIAMVDYTNQGTLLTTAS